MSSENPGSLVVVKNSIPVRKRVKLIIQKSFDYNQSVTKNPRKRFKK
jgi:hypothetical protein